MPDTKVSAIAKRSPFENYYRCVARRFSRPLHVFSLIAVTLVCLSSSSLAQSATGPLDRFAFFVPRVDAIVVGRVIDAGTRTATSFTSRGDTICQSERYATLQVDRTLSGPPLGPRLEVRLGQHAPLALFQSAAALSPEYSAIVYLNEDRTGWVVCLNISAEAHESFVGLELLTTADTPHRIDQIQARLQQCSPESMSLAADACVVGKLESFEEGTPSIRCRVKRVVFGAIRDEVISLRSDESAGLRLGEAVLFLKRLPGGDWGPLENGAGCIYVDLGTILKHSPSEASLTARAAAARTRVEGRKSE